MRIESVCPKNFLTFGPDTGAIEHLGPTTVIVGSNGSGKSSFLRAIEFIGMAFRGTAPWAGGYVHRGDPNNQIDLEATIRLAKREARIAQLGALLSLLEEVRPSGVQIDQ